jgi:hypothetical protein
MDARCGSGVDADRLPFEVTIMRTLSDTEALDRIHACLTGLEWSADTLEAIAALVDATGRPIARPSPDDRR